MNIIIFFILVFTVIQLIVCHFSLWWLIGLVCRILFSARIIGATFKQQPLTIAEGIGIAAMFLFHIMFKGDAIPWGRDLLFVLFSLLCIGLEYLDSLLYVYTVEDEDDIN